jgi:hypothetical protein
VYWPSLRTGDLDRRRRVSQVPPLLSRRDRVQPARNLNFVWLPALDPGLPLVTGTLQTPVGRALFGALADSLPDRWGRTLIQRAERARAKAASTAPRSMSEVDLLLGVRDDLRQGALRFRLDEHGPFLATEESGAPP